MVTRRRDNEEILNFNRLRIRMISGSIGLCSAAFLVALLPTTTLSAAPQYSAVQARFDALRTSSAVKRKRNLRKASRDKALRKWQSWHQAKPAKDAVERCGWRFGDAVCDSTDPEKYCCSYKGWCGAQSAHCEPCWVHKHGCKNSDHHAADARGLDVRQAFVEQLIVDTQRLDSNHKLLATGNQLLDEIKKWREDSRGVGANVDHQVNHASSHSSSHGADDGVIIRQKAEIEKEEAEQAAGHAAAAEETAQEELVRHPALVMSAKKLRSIIAANEVKRVSKEEAMRNALAAIEVGERAKEDVRKEKARTSDIARTSHNAHAAREELLSEHSNDSPRDERYRKPCLFLLWSTE